MERKLFFYVIIILFMTVLCNCEGKKEKNGEQAAYWNPPRTAIRDNSLPRGDSSLDNDITIVQAMDMITWDPTGSTFLANGYLITNVYSRLFTYDAYLKGIPEICREYNNISDTEWLFTIYEGIKFHDGSVMTADDVIYSLNRAKNTGNAILNPIKTITKVNEHTISVTTNGPYPSLVSALTHQSACIVPKKYGEQCERSGDWSKPVGSGRYMFDSRIAGESTKLVRFEDYYDKNDAALNRSLTFMIMPDSAKRTQAVGKGEADLNIDFDTFDFDKAEKDARVQIWQHDSQTLWHLGINTSHEYLNNRLIRQAISFAIDRAACMQAGHNGKGTVVWNSASFAPTCLGAVVNPLNMYSYDLNRAIALMAEAGCEGFDTEIYVYRDETERIANLCRGYLADIGINAAIKRITSADVEGLLAENKIPLSIISWGCYWDPDLFLSRRFSGWRFNKYQNDELDAMILKGRSSFNEQERIRTYRQIQEFLAVEAVEADLYVSVLYALAAKNLKGVEINVERAFNFHRLHY